MYGEDEDDLDLEISVDESSSDTGGIIGDMIKSLSDEERERIKKTLIDEDELAGEVWFRQARYTADRWFGGIGDKRKPLSTPKELAPDDPELDKEIINKLQEEVRELYLKKSEKKDAKNLQLFKKFFSVEYALSEESAYTALKSGNFYKSLDKK